MLPRPTFGRLLWHRMLLFLPCVALLMVSGLFITTHKPTQAQASLCPSQTFSQYPNPNPGISPSLRAITAISATDVWAVGSYSSTVNTPYQTLIEQWNGSSWAVISSPNNGVSYNSLAAISAVSATDIWAAGSYYDIPSGRSLPLFEHWNGSTWSLVPGPTLPVNTQPAVWGLAAIAANDVWAVGDGYNGHAWTAHWNGTVWATVSNPSRVATNLFGVKAFASNDVWAVGSDAASGSGSIQLVLHWNGSSWTSMPIPPINATQLWAIDGSSPSDLWALGSSYSLSTQQNTAFAEHWNGTAWTVVPTAPLANLFNGVFYSVSVLSPTDVFAVGQYQTTNALTMGLVEHWDGTTWSQVPSNVPAPPDDDTLFGVAAISTNNAWAVGWGIVYQPGTQETLIEHYPGGLGASFACHVG